MFTFKTFILFFATAIAEIIGCYLPYLWLNENKSIYLLIPAALSLILFSWLLTLHPTDAGRIYAAYGGVYVCTAILWMWLVENIKPTSWDIAGGFIVLIGVSVILYGSQH